MEIPPGTYGVDSSDWKSNYYPQSSIIPNGSGGEKSSGNSSSVGSKGDSNKAEEPPSLLSSSNGGGWLGEEGDTKYWNPQVFCFIFYFHTKQNFLLFQDSLRVLRTASAHAQTHFPPGTSELILPCPCIDK